MKSKQGLTSGLLAVLPVLVACSTDAGCLNDRGPIRSDSAGVSIVTNSGADSEYPATLTQLGELAPPDSALTSLPWGVVADPLSGSIFAVDRLRARVAVFDVDGRHLRDIGREGDGPSEFRSPAAAALDPYGALAVWDTGRGVLSRWTAEGVLLNEQRAPVSYWGPGFALRPDGVVTVRLAPDSPPLSLENQLYSLRAGEERVLSSLVQRQVQVDLPCGSMPAPRVFSPSIIWSATADRVFVSRHPEYAIDVLADGEVLRSVRRTITPLSPTRADALNSLQVRAGPLSGFLRGCGVSPEELIAAVGVEEVVSPIQSFALDPAGRIWVSRSTEGGLPSVLDVFSPDGTYEGSIQTATIPIAFVSSTRFVALEVDEVGGLGLYLYELRQGSDGGVDETSAGPQLGRVPTEEFRDCADCPVMVTLPPGDFAMGAPPAEEPAAANPRRPDWTEIAERPQVTVSLEQSFALGKFEVTFAEYDSCVADGGCGHRPDDLGWGRGDRPVINVTRDEALEFVTWLSEKTSETYRLPSEAEWEYGTRAGTTSSRYWGDEPDSRMASCDGCGASPDRSPAPVGSYPANQFGLHDSLGNVSEWVADCWTPSHEGHPGTAEARIEDSPYWRDHRCFRPVRRGGSWSGFAYTVRAASRLFFDRSGQFSERSRFTGFRVAREVDDR